MPQVLAQEVESNFDKFEAAWPKELVAAQLRLAPARRRFVDSYLRISSIQAWRSAVVVGAMDSEAEAFFFEAQNDFLVSHCLSRCGSFRQALKALRGAIENVYFALYYKDHPIELDKWLAGKHKLSFTELQSYLESHPRITDSSIELTGLDVLKAEYSTLSKAVHGSAKAFRMTRNLDDIRLWADDVASVNQWAAREKAVISSINLLLMHLFRDHLQGALHLGLRTSIALVIPAAKRQPIKAALGITIVAT